MILIFGTIIFILIGLIFFIIGMIFKNKIIKKFGILTFIVVIIFLLVIIVLSLDESNNDYERRFGNKIVNKENITNNSIRNVTDQFLNENFFKCGKIINVESNKIYFIDTNNNEYVLENSNEINYIDGRTGTKYFLDDLANSYYINLSYNQNCYIYKNLTGNELKKELLISLSLSDDVNMPRTNVDNIKEVKQLGNNQAIVTLNISDIVNSEFSTDIDESQIFDLKVKVTQNTKYHSKGNYTYNANTIENSKDTILNIILDSNTLNYEYPEVLKFDSSDT